MSVIPAVCDFKPHYKGSTFSPRSIKFNFNITGATILCQIRKHPGSTVVHEWKTGVNITVVNATTGEIVLNQINNFDVLAGNYKYDLQITFADGTNQTYLQGAILVVQDTTVAII